MVPQFPFSYKKMPVLRTNAFVELSFAELSEKSVC